VRTYLRWVISPTLHWTVRWAGVSTLVGIALMLARVPSPARSDPQPNEISGSDFWIVMSMLTIPASLVVSFVAANIVYLTKGRRETPKTTTRTGTKVWPVVTIFGSLVFVLCGAGAAVMGLAVSVDAPHAWKADPWLGLVWLPIAVALIVVGIIPARDSLRQLRSLRETRMSERATGSDTRP
jgi:hypothetical protein